MARGVGTIVTELLSSVGLSRHGCGCTDLANKWNRMGPDAIEEDLDNQVLAFKESIKKWRQNNTRLVPTPPNLVLRSLLIYAVGKSREESAL